MDVDVDESWARRDAAFQDPALDTTRGNMEECRREERREEEGL